MFRKLYPDSLILAARGGFFFGGYHSLGSDYRFLVYTYARYLTIISLILLSRSHSLEKKRNIASCPASVRFPNRREAALAPFVRRAKKRHGSRQDRFTGIGAGNSDYVGMQLF